MLTDARFWLALAAGFAAFLALSGLAAWRLHRRPGALDLLRRIAALGPRRQWMLARLLLRDGRVPLAVRALPLALVAYLVLPVDLVPDFIPVLGQLDDLALVALAAWLALRFTPRAVIEEHLRPLAGRA
jgi:uncharacterized membrane protein YkvA (DUF1232 family)